MSDLIDRKSVIDAITNAADKFDWPDDYHHGDEGRNTNRNADLFVDAVQATRNRPLPGLQILGSVPIIIERA